MAEQTAEVETVENADGVVVGTRAKATGTPGAVKWDTKNAPSPNDRKSIREDPDGKKNGAAAKKSKK